ncbi:MAG TPA: hypothetical protein VFQ66_01175 [Candidatus Limnocylindria bacterium]|nr:hypothetical protein [Candidatus Limnocylindria bacterium]
MRWLALLLVVPLLACESRVIVTRTPSASATTSPSASGAASPSPTPSGTPARIALQPVPNITPASRLLSYERGGDIGQPSVRFLLTDDGRVITEASNGDLVQRKLTPSGAATMVLQAIQTGLFERDADYGRTPKPGTTPTSRGATVLIFVVANGARVIRVSVVPTGQPDDELYEPSATRDKLTGLARGYEDLSWVPANSWAEATPQVYRAPAYRLFVLPQPGAAPTGGSPDVDAIWPFLIPIDQVGGPVGGTLGATWRCAILGDVDARLLGQSLERVAVISRFGSGAHIAAGPLAWGAGGGALRLELSPLLPHEPATCTGALPPI